MEAILENTRNPTILGEVDHTYQDKYALVEVVANSGIASYSNALKSIGLDDDIMEKVLNWVHSNQTVVLDFNGYMYSKLIKEEEVTLSVLKNILSIAVDKPTWSYHYSLHLDFALTIRSGDETVHLMDVSESIPFVKTSYHKLSGKDRHQDHCERVQRDLNLTYLLRMITGRVSKFTIDRYNSDCRTPVCNKNVKQLLDFIHKIHRFAHDVKVFLENAHRTHQMYDENATTKLNSPPQISADDIFVPIVPVLEKNSNMLSVDDLGRLLKEHVKTLDSITFAAIDKYKDSKFTSSKSMILQLVSDHITALSEQLYSSIGYIENMLERQLIEAIGKRIDSTDFGKFMKHHNQKFFNGDYAPVPFSRAVHIPGRYPDGVISIEESFDADDSEPIETLVRKISSNSSRSMVIPIDAATKVELWGDQYLHGWIQHVWENSRGKNHELVARAHQFSSYLLIIGVLGGGGTFIPKEALILKNKDEVIIPLLSEILPSTKEFKNAIASLSPEQQEFAKAFRAMQLESSVFGICVIPLKPQMENLLNLPEGALTKEIQLMEDLMSLFVEYQIPSDLLSFDGPEDTSGIDRVDAVKGHVAAVLSVIEGEKKKQMMEAKDRAKMAAQSEQHGAQKSSSSRAGTLLSDFDELMGDDQVTYGAAASKPSTESHSMPEPMRAFTTEEKDGYESMEANTREKSNFEQVQASTIHDFTSMPKLIDAKLDEQSEGALKSTIIKTGQLWERRRKENLLLPSQRSYLNEEKKSEKNKAIDLLKAISRSGSLPIAKSDLHVIVSVSHCFHKNVLSTVIQDNINPIEQVEKSLLMIGSLIHSVEPPMLLSSEEAEKREMMKETEIKFDAAIVKEAEKGEMMEETQIKL